MVMTEKQGGSDLRANSTIAESIGDGWFDDKWKPIFNDPRGVQAIEIFARALKIDPVAFRNLEIRKIEEKK